MSNFIKKEKKARRIAIWAIGIMIGIWVVLSIFSFTDSETRGRPVTDTVSFNKQPALRGKQVFQAYNCMDCHTIVGNGAYFAPDLTKMYDKTGPAWLKAYLGSPGTYPTKAIVNIQLKKLIDSNQVEVSDLDEYLKKYKGAQTRLTRRSGVDALMPNLQFSGDEIDALIAFLKYTSKLNTSGWPPKVIAKQSVIDQKARELEQESGLLADKTEGYQPVPAKTQDESSSTNAVEKGQSLTQNLGCAACHSTDGSEVVGPSFKGLYNSKVTLEGDQKVTADTAYLRESILHPNKKVVKGFPKGVMPSFDRVVSDAELDQLIEYIKTLK